MFLMISRKPRKKTRGKTNRMRAKLKAKNRRRVNAMAKRRRSARGVPSNG